MSLGSEVSHTVPVGGEALCVDHRQTLLDGFLATSELPAHLKMVESERMWHLDQVNDLLQEWTRARCAAEVGAGVQRARVSSRT